jgi:hypothetical protein
MECMHPPETGLGGVGNIKVASIAIYTTRDWIERQYFLPVTRGVSKVA